MCGACQVVAEEELLAAAVEDIALLHCKYTLQQRSSRSFPTLSVHCCVSDETSDVCSARQHVPPLSAGLGVRVVIVIGARQQIDDLLAKQGEAPQYAAGYRVTDAAAMQTAIQAAGASRMAVEAQLSRVCCLHPSCPKSALPHSCRHNVALAWCMQDLSTAALQAGTLVSGAITWSIGTVVEE